MRVSRLKLGIMILLGTGGSLAMASAKLLPEPEANSYTVIGNIDNSGFKEPSGICFHPIRKTLFVIGDSGYLGELKTDGTMLRVERIIKKADFEGVTCNPASGLLYVAVEGEEVILEIDPDRFQVLREFKIERTFEGEIRMKKGGDGIEAITFVPDDGNPDGGSFYVANQGKDLTNTADASALFELAVPLSDPNTKVTATIKRCFSIGAIDMSGLQYDAMSSQLLVVSDKMDTLFQVALDGTVHAAHVLPGEDQEGITRDDDGFLYIAQDSGGILKLKQ
ncbi:SdiA-regulated domain-containing protein [Pontiellaceae bacterium B12219]|nr:SdiA-regulated domain-containing protein [Pontiellaceae bacterium B12219]